MPIETSSNLPGSRIFPERSVQGSYFVALDGEGIGNDYVLLDSSQTDYPELCTGSRLSSRDCLDWLWNLCRRHGYAEFVIFGAGYDFNNIVRDCDRVAVDKLANGEPVRIGAYVVQWQRGYRFLIRHIIDRSGTFERVRTGTPDGKRFQNFTTMTIWDVYPFWQASFERALDMTLGESAYGRDLIAWGKEAREHFSWDDLPRMKAYNKAELVNLERMMRELDSWFAQAGITISNWNGPGAPAKAALRKHKPYLHAGRRAFVSRGTPRVREYSFPGVKHDEIWRAALGSYAGGRNELLAIGRNPGRAFQYDIISAYPSACVSLPCLTHGKWRKVRAFDESKFGLWSVSYDATRELRAYPFFFRAADGAIHYPCRFQHRWAHTVEVASALSIDASGVQVNGGFIWESTGCDNPFPMSWIADEFRLRRADKAAGRIGASQGRKLVLNSEYGNMAQARGGTVDAPPWAQQLLWAGAITATTRAKLYDAAMERPEAICHLATDGVIATEPLSVPLGSELGEWEVTELNDLVLVQYGIYFAQEKSRSRGVPLRYVSRDAVLDGWRRRLHSIPVTQKMFVTAGLVANNQQPYGSWCHWIRQTEDLAICDSSAYRWGYPQTLDRLWPVTEVTWQENVILSQSAPYEPKWGRTPDMPDSWIADDLVDEAFSVGEFA